jgi:LmbE family N-acetylglucosaminyl deacetylase
MTGHAVLCDPEVLKAASAVVIAPHPDDESLGCGGLISLLAAAGTSFHTIFVTDGGASHLNSVSWPRSRVTAQREQEAAAALARLGISRHPRTFLRLRDGETPGLSAVARGAALSRLAEIFRSFRPDLVFMPWRRDPHCDHRESWRLAKTAIAITMNNPRTFEYAIWLDELGRPEDFPKPDEAERVVFDITSAVRAKRAAISAHQSQTTNLIGDDPTGFRLTTATINRLSGPYEAYWRSVS